MPQAETIQITQYKTYWNIREVAESKGIENPYQLHKLCPRITSPRAIKFWNGGGRLSPSDVNYICDALQCEPHDLIIRKLLEDNVIDK